MNYNEKIKFWASLEGFFGVGQGALYVGFLIIIFIYLLSNVKMTHN